MAITAVSRKGRVRTQDGTGAQVDDSIIDFGGRDREHPRSLTVAETLLFGQPRSLILGSRSDGR